MGSVLGAELALLGAQGHPPQHRHLRGGPDRWGAPVRVFKGQVWQNKTDMEFLNVTRVDELGVTASSTSRTSVIFVPHKLWRERFELVRK